MAGDFIFMLKTSITGIMLLATVMSIVMVETVITQYFDGGSSYFGK